MNMSISGEHSGTNIDIGKPYLPHVFKSCADGNEDEIGIGYRSGSRSRFCEDVAIHPNIESAPRLCAHFKTEMER